MADNTNNSEQKIDIIEDVNQNESKDNECKTNKVNSNMVTEAQNQMNRNADDIVVDLLDHVIMKNNRNNKNNCPRKFCNVFGYNKNKKEPVLWVNFAMESEGSSDPDRGSFITLVLVIVLVMLVATALLVLPIYLVEKLAEIFATHSLPFVICGSVLVMIMSMAMSCSPCTRDFPCNILCLIFVVFGESIVVACVILRYRADEVFIGLMATIFVVICCVLLSLTPFDFTKFLIYVVIFGFALMAVGIGILIYNLLVGPMPVIRCIYLGAGTLLNVAMLIIELQMILGGKSVEMNESDYALGAMLVYTSVIQLFLNLLSLIESISDLMD